MANSLNTNPIIIDTDLASFRTSAGYVNGIRPFKITLSVGSGGASSSGTVTITLPSNSQALYPPTHVLAGQSAYTTLTVDNPFPALNWPNFAVTGVTATGTTLYIWY